MKLMCGVVLKYLFNIVCMVFLLIVIFGNVMEIYKIDSKVNLIVEGIIFEFFVCVDCFVFVFINYDVWVYWCVYNKVLMKK